MNKKYLKLLSLSISSILAIQNTNFAIASEMDGNSIASVDYQNIDESDFTNETSVFAEIASNYEVTIPKIIVFDGKDKTADYFVKVVGDIAGYETISVIPDENFKLFSTNKNSEIATITQDKTIWTDFDFDKDANGIIIAPEITAGYWSGTFNFDINLTHTSDYKPIEYTITYNLDGGTITTDTINYTIETDDFKLEEPEKPGYEFIGWSGTDLNEIIKDVEIKKGSTGNRIYTAHWKPITYTITYNLNGGNLSGQKLEYNIETEDFTLPLPNKKDFIFAGWSGSNISNIDKNVTIKKGTFGNKTFTANWTNGSSLRKYSASDTTVSYSYNSNDGTYTITQKGGSTGWGQGVMGDNSKLAIPWGKEYCYTFECYIPTQATIRLDHNVEPYSGSMSYTGNDCYSNPYVIVDGVKNGSATLTPNTWHTLEIRFTNGDNVNNPNHVTLKSYSTFGFDLTGKSTFTYKVRNMTSRIVM